MKYIKVLGILELPNEVSVDDFIDKFIELVESEGGYFLGRFSPNVTETSKKSKKK